VLDEQRFAQTTQAAWGETLLERRGAQRHNKYVQADKQTYWDVAVGAGHPWHTEPSNNALRKQRIAATLRAPKQIRALLALLAQEHATGITWCQHCIAIWVVRAPQQWECYEQPMQRLV
jgi:hypothetical protein